MTGANASSPPAWLVAAAPRGVWDDALLGTWKRWKSALEQRGVTSDMLFDLCDEGRLIGIGTTPPHIGWRAAWLNEEKYGEHAIRYALQDLISELDKPGGNQDAEGPSARAKHDRRA